MRTRLQRDVTAVDQVEQSPGRRHEDVRAACEPRLLDDPGPAVDGGDGQCPGVGYRAKLLDDLERELPCRGEDQR